MVYSDLNETGAESVNKIIVAREELYMCEFASVCVWMGWGGVDDMSF